MAIQVHCAGPARNCEIVCNGVRVERFIEHLALLGGALAPVVFLPLINFIKLLIGDSVLAVEFSS